MVLIFLSLAASIVLAVLASAAGVTIGFAMWRRVDALRARGDDPAPGVVFNTPNQPWRGRGGQDAGRFFRQVNLNSIQDGTLRTMIRGYRWARIIGLVAAISFAACLALVATQVCWGCR
jgi:hypothetical protein